MMIVLAGCCAAGAVIVYSGFTSCSLVLALTIIVGCLAAVADADVVLTLFDKLGGEPDAKLKGRVVWIIGASQGIGSAVAVRLAQCGAKLALSSRNEQLLLQVRQDCIGAGCLEKDVLVVPLDITCHEDHSKAMDVVVKHFGKIDCLLNNAGRSQRAMWDDIQISVDRDLFELNTFSLVALARLVNKHFKQTGGGHHVITSSVAGRMGAPRSASYTASKHALHGYFECLRFEGAQDNISVTMLCPGPVETPLLKAAYTDTLGKPVEVDRTGKRMSAERCARLSVTAMAYKLPEVWIAEQPVLTLLYLVQYLPGFVALLLRFLPLGFVMKLRDGRADTVSTNANK